jgi:hypothetical protein
MEDYMNIEFRKISDLKVGDYFKLNRNSKEIFERGEYDREFKGYRCDYTSDISKDKILDGQRLVKVDIEY